jgi:hypothetical protein
MKAFLSHEQPQEGFAEGRSIRFRQKKKGNSEHRAKVRSNIADLRPPIYFRRRKHYNVLTCEEKKNFTFSQYHPMSAPVVSSFSIFDASEVPSKILIYQ